METSQDDRDATSQLAAIDVARRDFAGSLVTPRWYDGTVGVAAGANVAAVGLVLAEGSMARRLAGVALLVVAMAAIGWSVRRFRAANGAWVSGLRAGPTARVTAVGSTIQVVLGFVAAMAAIAAGWWWLGLVLAPLQVLSFVITSRRWMDVYRAEHGA